MIQAGKAKIQNLRAWAARKSYDFRNHFWFICFLFGRESAYSLHLRIKREGYDAYMLGAALGENPYPNEREIDDLPHGSWREGWHEGGAILAQARQVDAPPGEITHSSRKEQR